MEQPKEPAPQPPANRPEAPLERGAAESLADVRQRIDAIDEQLVRLISERGQLAAKIGKIKAGAGAPVYAPDREKEILQKLRERNLGPFPDRVLHAIYRELMSGSLALERPQRIAYLGPRGSFSHLAATNRFGASVEYEPVADIRGAFAEVAQGHADFAIVPVENSIGGGVVDTLDAFLDNKPRICAEINLAVHQNLLARGPLERIERLYSKPEAFDQCKQWLLETGLLGKTVPVASTSKAAELAAAEENTAAIGSTLAAELYHVPVLVSNIEDNPNNVTRFFVLGHAAPRPTGDDKTTIMFITAHRAGALVDVLDVFRAHGVNLTMITSRPTRRHNWEYCFFVDAEGHLEEEAMSKAVAAAREFCLQLSVLGSFPRAPESL